jgi:hypothetical protein
VNRRYAIFDAAALGTDLDIQRGGVLLTTIAPGRSIERSCRLTVGVIGFESYGEFLLFGFEGTVIANRVSIGVVTDQAGPATYVGGDAHGIGYRVGEGQIHTNGASAASVAAGALGDVLGVRYVPGADGGGDVVFYRMPDGGTPVTVGSLALPAGMVGKPLYLAVSLGSTTEAGDLSIQANTGQDAFELFPAFGAERGWWEAPAISGNLRVGDVPFLTGRDDAPSYTRFEQGITSADVVIDRVLSFWPWGSRPARGSAVSITVTDPDGRWDGALGGAYRDQPATLRIVSGSDFAGGEDVEGFVVERIEATSELERRITLRDQLARFQVGLGRRRIRPDADEEAAFGPWPNGFGCFFSAPVPLLDKTTRTYAIDSVGVQGVGIVRDAGDPLTVSAVPPDYELIRAGQMLVLESEPFGLVTVDAGVTGDGYTPAVPVDGIDGDGNPFTDNGIGGITNWIPGSQASETLPAFVAPDRVAFTQNTEAKTSWIKWGGGQLLAGKTYRFSITVHQIQHAPVHPAYLGLSYSETHLFSFWSTQSGTTPGSGTGTFTGIYSPDFSHDLYITYRPNNIVGGLPCIVSAVSFVEIPPVDTEANEDEIEDELTQFALPLAEMMRQAIEVRAGFDADVWNRASAEAIDAATGYIGQGWWSADQVTLLDYLDRILDSYTASIGLANDGRLTVYRMLAPEDEVSTGEIGPTDILTPPLPRWDAMPGLTRQGGVRRNEHVFTDSELASTITQEQWRLRRKLTRRHRFLVATGAPLAPGLDHADAAEPADWRLVKRADGQAEIDRIGSIASRSRAFYGPFAIRDPQRFDLGQIITLTYPRWGLEAGRKVMVVGIRARRLAGTGDITVWGLSPEEPA